MTAPPDPTAVTVIGAGIAGVACARALHARGIPVRVLDRGRAPGGRMASPRQHDRRADLGAGYFTVKDEGFRAVVDAWAAAGLARPWTDTFSVLAPGQAPTSTTGPMRWAAPGGLRSLVRRLLEGIDVTLGAPVEQLPSGVVALAMPDPQAARLVEVPEPVGYDPVIAMVAGFADRAWPFDAAAFVHDHPDIEFLADDGSRRGDGAAVLVVHSTAAFARRQLAVPDRAVAPLVAALRELLGVGDPRWTSVHRWTFAKPTGTHDRSFGLIDRPGAGIVGLAGDQWCPAGSPRVESAWRSGTDLGDELAERLSTGT